MRSKSLHTVCESARCPNICECFGKKTATFLIMGDVCTRRCGFCAVKHGTPLPLDGGEPARIAVMADELGLKHAVITSVTRDDLPGGGASHFAAAIEAVKKARGGQRRVEVLTPDFQGDRGAIRTVLDARPDVFNHNLETVRRLTGMVRDKADFSRSIGVLRFAKKFSGNILVKSGMMVGLGETDGEVFETLRVLAGIGCDIVTVGQYLRPGRENLGVERYVPPERFGEYAAFGESLGIGRVFAAPLVRSSYMSKDVFEGSWQDVEKVPSASLPTNSLPATYLLVLRQFNFDG